MSLIESLLAVWNAADGRPLLSSAATPDDESSGICISAVFTSESAGGGATRCEPRAHPDATSERHDDSPTPGAEDRASSGLSGSAVTRPCVGPSSRTEG